LWGTELSAEVRTECAHCGRAIHLDITSDLQTSVRESEADPLIFSPDMDLEHLNAPNILDDV